MREFQVNLHFLSYWDVLTAEDATLLKSGQRLPEDLPGHAQEFETAIALARFPENVREDAMKEQSDKSPQSASAEVGEAMLARVVERVSTFCREVFSGQRQQAIPPFHP